MTSDGARSLLGRPQSLATRRQWLIGATLSGGALVIGGIARSEGAAPGASAPLTAADFDAFGPFLRIDGEGVVTVVSKYSELGQGAQTGMAALVAEELDADWTRVRVVSAPANQHLYAHLTRKTQLTGGSSSVSDSWLQLRRTGAAARAMFVTAAAHRWGAPEAEVTVRDGVVAHPASSRSATFGELLEDAARMPPPTEPRLKSPGDFRFVGSRKLGRLDARAKSTGTARYTQDVHLPGMLTAMVAHSPRFGGKVKSFDATKARQMPGVIAVFEIPSGVAILAKDTYRAKLGREALLVTWDDAQAEMRSTDQILADHRRIAADEASPEWVTFQSTGDSREAFAAGARVVSIELDFPYLAHASMEPMNCVAQVDGKRVKLTFGAQNHTGDQRNVAALLGCEVDSVAIDTLPAGGSFGRRSVATSDYQREAVEIARKVGGFTPVKLVWTREDDMGGGYYRPLTHHRMDVALDAEGYPAAWRHRLVSASLLKGTPVEAGIRNGVDGTVVEGVMGSPYLKATPVVDARCAYPTSPIPVLWLRSVGANHTAMAMEHAIDQLARAARIDPVAYRRSLYAKAGAKAHLATLDLALEKSGWAEPIEPGWARGVAVHECFGTTVANVAEVRLTAEGTPLVRRVVVAVSCGTAVVPDLVVAQMESGVYYGLSFALFGEVKIKDGLVQTVNFDTYRVLRMNEAPTVETYIIPSTEPPTGAGEPGTPVIGPAVANALLALTGKPTTSLPFVRA